MNYKKNINKILKLSLINLNKKEKKNFFLELKNFFNLIKKIKFINTKNIIPLYSPLLIFKKKKINFRKDIFNNKNKKTIEINNNYYYVPKILK